MLDLNKQDEMISYEASVEGALDNPNISLVLKCKDEDIGTGILDGFLGADGGTLTHTVSYTPLMGVLLYGQDLIVKYLKRLKGIKKNGSI